MAKYKKIERTEIEAVQYIGTDENKVEIWNFCKGANIRYSVASGEKETITIYLASAMFKADIGDYIIKSEDGKIATISKDVFESTYEPAWQ